MEPVAHCARWNTRFKDTEMGSSDDGDAHASRIATPFSVRPLTVRNVLDETTLLFSNHMPIRMTNDVRPDLSVLEYCASR